MMRTGVAPTANERVFSEVTLKRWSTRRAKKGLLQLTGGDLLLVCDFGRSVGSANVDRIVLEAAVPELVCNMRIRHGDRMRC